MRRVSKRDKTMKPLTQSLPVVVSWVGPRTQTPSLLHRVGWCRGIAGCAWRLWWECAIVGGTWHAGVGGRWEVSRAGGFTGFSLGVTCYQNATATSTLPLQQKLLRLYKVCKTVAINWHLQKNLSTVLYWTVLMLLLILFFWFYGMWSKVLLFFKCGEV